MAGHIRSREDTLVAAEICNHSSFTEAAIQRLSKQPRRATGAVYDQSVALANLSQAAGHTFSRKRLRSAAFRLLREGYTCPV